MFLRVECLRCHISWNFYDEKIQYPPQLTTAVEYLGATCPRCGFPGSIGTTLIKKIEEVSQNANR